MKWAIVPALLMSACIWYPRPKPPQPSPTPTPTPTPAPTLPPLLLRQVSPPYLTRDGQPFTPKGFIQCCMATNTIQTASGKRAVRKPMPFKPTSGPKSVRTEINTLWPLASEAWMNYTQEKGGANFFHFRMGPFYAAEDQESEWQAIGGPYAGGPGSDWNPAFWAKYRDLIAHARKIGANVEIVPVDTWYCKHAASNWGDQQMPWPQSDIDSCGIRPSPEQEKYIRKVVSEACMATNVVWLTDNEGGEIRGNTRQWFEWVRTVIRDEEAQCAARVGSAPIVRMVGTNQTNYCDGPFDYCATHARAPLTTPIASKHTENNERNPDLGSPEAEHAAMCGARAAGLHWWFWRAEMSDVDFERTMALFKSGCGGPVGCFPPPDNDPLWGENVTGSGQMRAQVESAKAAVGERCGSIPPHEAGNTTLDALAAVLRERGECAGRSVDSVFVKAPDGWWEEYHSVSFVSGCWAQNPAVLPKYRWKYNGTNPEPAGCPVDVPTVDEILCKPHVPVGVYDCTPKANGQPILPEGNPDRWACELEAMGGQPPVYTLGVLSGNITLQTQLNPMQFKIIGSGAGTVRCTVPAVSGTLCNAAVSR